MGVAFRMRSECGVEDLASATGHSVGAAVVNVVGGVPGDAGVAVVLVVFVEEPAEVGAGVIGRGEDLGECEIVFRGLE